MYVSRGWASFASALMSSNGSPQQKGTTVLVLVLLASLDRKNCLTGGAESRQHEAMKTFVYVVSFALMFALVAGAAVVTTNEPFPAAGDAYCSATNGCGTIPAAGQTAFMWTAGDYVLSSIFVLPTDSVTGLTANWSYQDYLGAGNTETWFVYVNGFEVASGILPNDNFHGDILNFSGTFGFPGIAPVSGGYQVELILQNTVPLGAGSVAWLDGGTTGLSYDTGVPEPGSMLLLGSGILFAGLVRRKVRR